MAKILGVTLTFIHLLKWVEYIHLSVLLQVLVWHTRTEVPNMKHEKRLIESGNPSDPNIET